MELSQLLLIIGLAAVVLAAGGASAVLILRKHKEKQAEDYLNESIYSQEIESGKTSNIAEPDPDETENVWASNSAYTTKE